MVQRRKGREGEAGKTSALLTNVMEQLSQPTEPHSAEKQVDIEHDSFRLCFSP